MYFRSKIFIFSLIKADSLIIKRLVSIFRFFSSKGAFLHIPSCCYWEPSFLKFGSTVYLQISSHGYFLHYLKCMHKFFLVKKPSLLESWLLRAHTQYLGSFGQWIWSRKRYIILMLSFLWYLPTTWNGKIVSP